MKKKEYWYVSTVESLDKIKKYGDYRYEDLTDEEKEEFAYLNRTKRRHTPALYYSDEIKLKVGDRKWIWSEDKNTPEECIITNIRQSTPYGISYQYVTPYSDIFIHNIKPKNCWADYGDIPFKDSKKDFWDKILSTYMNTCPIQYRM